LKKGYTKFSNSGLLTAALDCCALQELECSDYYYSYYYYYYSGVFDGKIDIGGMDVLYDK